SSRRRHTRFSRDWSSDVCSSDLTGRGHSPQGLRGIGMHAAKSSLCISNPAKWRSSMQIASPSASPIQAFTPSAARATQTPTEATPQASNRPADRVTLSDAGLRAAKAAQTPDHPLAMYQLPAWMAGSYIEAPNTLGASANWLDERYPQVAAASSAERTEYSQLLQSTYQALLKDNGIQRV